MLDHEPKAYDDERAVRTIEAKDAWLRMSGSSVALYHAYDGRERLHSEEVTAPSPRWGQFFWNPLIENSPVFRNLVFGASLDYYENGTTEQIETREQRLDLGIRFENLSSVDFSLLGICIVLKECVEKRIRVKSVKKTEANQVRGKVSTSQSHLVTPVIGIHSEVKIRSPAYTSGNRTPPPTPELAPLNATAPAELAAGAGRIACRIA